MSYNLHPFNPPPIKRARETISFANDGATKCGEIFVTNNAAQWTFHCAYCPKAASDIGIFICHIRLEHLKVQTELTTEQTSNVSPKTIADSLENGSNLNWMAELTTNSQQQSPPMDIVKEEETIACSQENLQTSCAKVADITDITSIKNSIPKTQQDNEVIFTITPIGSEETQQQLIFKQVNKDITQVVYVKNEAEMEYESNNLTDDINKEANNDSVNDSDSFYSPNEDDGDDTDFEIKEDHESNGSSKNKIVKKIRTALNKISCPYCSAELKNRDSATRHIYHFHDKQLPIRCKKCQRGFLTANGLKVHLKNHNDFQCPVCKKELVQNNFISHVLTHESATCFPCQVCGKLYVNQEERMNHWKTHAQEKPFPCNICYRRYDQTRYLNRHLKSHSQHQCNFCPSKFNATEDQRPPYVCAKCEKLTDIKQRAEYFKSLTVSNPIFDSDDDTIKTLNFVNDKNYYNNSEAISSNFPTGDVSDGTESHKQYECSLCSSVYNTPETQRSPYFCGKCENLPEVTNTEDITNITTNMPGSFNKSNANITHDEDLIDCDSDLEFIDDNVPSGSSKNKIKKNIISASEDKSLSTYKCPFCIAVFKSKRSSTRHLFHVHDKQLPIRCDECHRGFLTATGLKVHMKNHDENYHFQCPVCKTNHLESYFIKHVLTHESATCFPCQVCGKLYASQEERMTHWKTHAQEKPFACNICYRRFLKNHDLVLHLKSHNHYLCKFCPAQFNATEDQRPPYVCVKCEKLPDIKQRVKYMQYLNTLTDSNPMFDSDEDTITTLNSVDELGLKHGKELPSSINQDSAATIESIPDSGSNYNSDSNTFSSYAPYDNIVNGEDNDPLAEDGSDLEDDTPTISQRP